MSTTIVEDVTKESNEMKKCNSKEDIGSSFSRLWGVTSVCRLCLSRRGPKHCLLSELNLLHKLRTCLPLKVYLFAYSIDYEMVQFCDSENCIEILDVRIFFYNYDLYYRYLKLISYQKKYVMCVLQKLSICMNITTKLNLPRKSYFHT